MYIISKSRSLLKDELKSLDLNAGNNRHENNYFLKILTQKHRHELILNNVVHLTNTHSSKLMNRDSGEENEVKE